MDTSRPTEQVQDKIPSAVAEAVPNDTVDTHEQQLNVMPATGSFLKLIPEVSVEANMNVSAIDSPFGNPFTGTFGTMASLKDN